MGKSCRGELELSAEPRTCSLVSNPCLQATVVVVVMGGGGGGKMLEIIANIY